MGVKIDVTRDEKFNAQGIALLEKYYANGPEGIQRALARAANCFSYGDEGLAQRIYDAASKHWFMYSSPVLSNAVEGHWEYPVTNWEHNQEGYAHRGLAWKGGEPKAMPIACFLTYAGDSIDEQIATSSELSLLSVMGGGTAVHSGIRAVSEKAPGPIPYIKTIDGIMGYYRQGRTRRGSTAVYLDISHPDIVEFIKMRTPSGGDPARKIDNRMGVHNAVNISQAFADAVGQDLPWDLRDPHSGETRDTIRARVLWELILETRELTGEPYLYFIDVANRALPDSQRLLGLSNKGSNLCSEITLATDSERTAVCCLSSLNLEYYDEWKDTSLVADLVRFLDNVLQWFIDYSPDALARARYSAIRERAIGIGAMGFHNYLMRNKIPFESGGFNSAAQKNYLIFHEIHRQGIEASKQLAAERGEPADMEGTGRRNSHVFAIAPNSNSSVLCNTSPSIEPIASNAYTQKSRAGIFLVKNKYLEPILDAYNQNQDSVWKSIIDNNGSVQHLDFLSDEEKKVFKTAWEINQHWLVEHAGNRQPFICQAQSLNVFFLPGTDRAYINSVHLKAMREQKVKSMYYMRTGTGQAADTVKSINRIKLEEAKAEPVCISCEG
jgi:ribonucleoside-diphosphate reductase alpha chain